MALSEEQKDALLTKSPEELITEIEGLSDKSTDLAAAITAKETELEALKKPPTDPDPIKKAEATVEDKLAKLDEQIQGITIDGVKAKLAAAYPNVPIEKLKSTTAEGLLDEAKSIHDLLTEATTKKDEEIAILKKETTIDAFGHIPKGGQNIVVSADGVVSSIAEIADAGRKTGATQHEISQRMCNLATEAILTGKGLTQQGGSEQ